MKNEIDPRLNIEMTQLCLPHQINRYMCPWSAFHLFCILGFGIDDSEIGGLFLRRETTYQGEIVVEISLEEVECRIIDGDGARDFMFQSRCAEGKGRGIPRLITCQKGDISALFILVFHCLRKPSVNVS